MADERKWTSVGNLGIQYRDHPTRRHGVRKDRYYRVRYRLDGKQLVEVLGWASEGMTLEKAQAIVIRLKESHRTGQGLQTLKEMREAATKARKERSKQGLTLGDFWDEDYQHVLKERVAQVSWEKEVAHFATWIGPCLGNKALAEVGELDAERLLRTLRKAGRSARTQEYVLGTFRRIWKHALRRKLVSGECPVDALPLSKPENTRLRVLTQDEAASILEALQKRDIAAYAVTLFCLLTGCRASEAFGLLWEHVDLDRRAVLFPKTKNRQPRQVFLSSDVVSMLQEMGPGNTGQHVFLGLNGNPYRQAPSAFKGVVEALGLNDGRAANDRICFHTLRHTAATMAARGGEKGPVNVKDFQLAYGWKTPSMVFRYVKGNEDEQRRVMDDLAVNIKPRR